MSEGVVTIILRIVVAVGDYNTNTVFLHYLPV